ncbi:hypothetical protein KJ762_04225 [bacterium]|nr:hypothetical protein [bacterium]MBU1063215.1 hypothetical protein [bacterium]MBU1633700.1 hypothetical protein [bacterium]MBU1875122.1 hypothetical protein [bacterium]
MIKPAFIFSILILASCAFAQNNIIGTTAPGDMITLSVSSGIGKRTIWVSPTLSVVDYSYEQGDNELYLALCAGLDWKQRLRISLVMPARRSHEGGIGDLLTRDLDWISSRKRVTALVRVAELPASRITLGFSAGLWQLAPPRYWDDPPRFAWNECAGLHIDKPLNKGNAALSVELVRLSDEFQSKSNQYVLVHAGAGCQHNITGKLLVLGELRYDQAFPKYLDNELLEVLDWYSASLGLKYNILSHVIISANVTVGFRNSIILWPKSESSFDLAKETVQIIWAI